MVEEFKTTETEDKLTEPSQPTMELKGYQNKPFDSEPVALEAETREVLTMPAPTQLWATAGENPRDFREWLDEFKTYLVATGIAGKDSKRKQAIYQMFLGQEGRKLLKTLRGPKESIEDVSVLLENHFYPVKNRAVMRNKFLKQKARDR